MSFAPLSTYVISSLLLVTGEKLSWPIIIAGLLILLLLFLILKPLKHGIIDVLRYYRTKEVKDKWLNSLLDNLIAIILAFIIFFPPLAFGGVDEWAVAVLELSILFLFFVFILKSARAGVIEYRKNILNVLFVLFISYLIFQIFFKRTLLPYQTFLVLKSVSLYFALFIVITNNIRHRREIDNIIFKIMSVGVFISIIGILQLITGADKIWWIRKPYYPVFFGTFGYWNQFACYVSMATLLTLGSLCVKISEGKEISWNLPPNQILRDIVDNTLNRKTIFMFISFAIMITSLFLSKSRAGIVCFLAAFLFFVSSILSRKYSKKIISCLVFGILVASLIIGLILLNLAFMGLRVELAEIGSVLKELHTILSPGEYVYRATLYTVDAPKIFKDYPFFGIGFGSLYHILPLYLSTVDVVGWGLTPGFRQVAVTARYMFNDTLQLLIEVGLVGFFILLIPFLMFLTKLVKKIGRAQSEYKYLVGMGILSSLFFLGMHTLIDYDMSLSAISSLFTILLSISLLVMSLSPVRNNLEIEVEAKKIIILKTKWAKMLFYLFSTVIFIYLAFIISRPLIVISLTRYGATFSSFKRALALDPQNNDLHHRYHEFILNQYKKDYITKDVAFNKAEVAIDKAIKINPYKTAYLIAKADLELLKKNYQKASSLYEEASLMEPNNPVIQMGCAAAIFWQAIHEKYIREKKDILLKKGLIYYSKSRILSNKRLSLSSIIKDKKTLSFLRENLKREGIDIR